MNYRHIRKAKTEGFFWELGLPFFFLGVLVLFHFMYPTLIGDFASRLASPFWKAEQFVIGEFKGTLSFFSSKQSLIENTERLTRELESAQIALLDREILLEENETLKEQFSRFEDKDSRLIAAVLSIPPQSVYDTAIIDVGEAEGVRQGDLALSGSVALGTIQKVFRHTSRVEFFSTAGKKMSVSILHNKTTVPAEVIGEGAGSYSSLLPKEVSISVGDQVIMSDLSPLIFARVEAIENNPADSFQTIRFRNPVSFQSLRFLEIRKGSTENSL